MSVEIRRVSGTTDPDYERLLETADHSLFVHTTGYRDLLKRVCPESTDCYLLALDSGEPLAALPLFYRTGRMGVVFNSLPFYGSNGSFICTSKTDLVHRQALLEEYAALCRQHQAIASLIIENPLEPLIDELASSGHIAVDDRIGQMTFFPELPTGQDIESMLMSMVHQKTRNVIRKNQGLSYRISHNGSLDTLRRLYDLHVVNMAAIGGQPKPWTFFAAIPELFSYDRDYRVYTSSSESGEIVALLLLFYHRDMIEYFTPVIAESSRADQPLSGLIFQAMADGIRDRGSRIWNWGGTWNSQKGVYLFKSRWGTRDLRYRYFSALWGNEPMLLQSTPAEILSEYPYFYLLPFSRFQVQAQTA